LLVVGGLSALLPTQSNQLFSIVALVLIALFKLVKGLPLAPEK
jgi:hypothetical protein